MSHKLYNDATSALGTSLTPRDQAYVLAAFCHRYTGQHVPRWAAHPRPDGSPYPVQFRDDAEWLANTRFAINLNGLLDRRVSSCYSSPTWPFNPDLRKPKLAPFLIAAPLSQAVH